jgi:hypothetical protein
MGLVTSDPTSAAKTGREAFIAPAGGRLQADQPSRGESAALIAFQLGLGPHVLEQSHPE